MIRKLMLLILCLCFSCTGYAAESRMLSAASVSAELKAHQASPGQAEIQVTLTNHLDEELTVILFAPEADGQSASFGIRDASLTVKMDPLSTQDLSVLITADSQGAAPEEVSLRFCFQENMTTPAVISLGEGNVVSAEEIPKEEWMLAPDVLMAEEAATTESILLQDSLQPAQAAQLNQARVKICLKKDGEDQLIHLITLPARVDHGGQASVEYSGLALMLAEEPCAVLSANEKTDAAGTEWTSERITLYGEDLYFAVLSARITWQGGRARVEEQAIQAEEIGRAGPASFKLFEDGTISSLQYKLTEEDGKQIPTPDNALFSKLKITGPLHLKAVPASSLGSIFYYFEYEMMDGEGIIHEAKPLIMHYGYMSLKDTD